MSRPGVDRVPSTASPRPRLVTVTPAGRRRYVQILASHLLRNRHVIDEHQWWVNTRAPEDVAYLLRLCDAHPDFFRLVIRPYRASEPIGYAIWRFMAECVAADTVYLRLDDDICYIGDGAIAAILARRLADPHPFLVLGNIVNNSICSHFHQAAGLIPRTWGGIGQECMDPVGWNDGRMAVRIHRWFLGLVDAGNAETLAAVPFAYDGLRRFSINAICWHGADMAALPERERCDVDEEPFLTADVPNRLGRPNVICPEAIFAHFAFYTQRRYVESVAPDVLHRYWQLTGPDAATHACDVPSGAEFSSRMMALVGRARWWLRRLETKMRRLVRSAAGPKPEPAA